MLTKERIELTEHIQSLNITAYNQKDRATPFRKRKSNSTSLHNYSFVKMRASTAMSETQPIPEDKCKSVEKQSTDLQTLNKSTLKHENQHKKRRHITDSHNNTYGVTLITKNSEKDVNKDQGVTARRKSEVGSILQSKRSTIGPISITSKVNFAKKSKTGKQLVLNDSHFQSWINEVLLQSCDQKFDKSINLCAIKKYMIDSASLSAFGIKQSEISRIYRSLHVYSVGFSKLIKEIRGVSTKAYRNIWKVYSVLLEYCSTGDFQTMMSEIENQNARKLQKMEDQLQEKQEIIQQNDELNRQKNSKIFKQLKTLKQENFQLVLEKDVITNDARQFQKAFGEQVALRMLFQEKISSIYCVYNELSSKHSVLYKDFHTKSTQLGLLLQENKRISEQNSKIKKEMVGIQSDNKILTHQLAQAKEQIAKLEDQYRKRSTQQSEFKLQRLNMAKELLEAQQQSKKMTKQAQIIEENNKLLIETNHMQQLEYELCLSQNKRLLSTLEQQFAINKKYFQDRQKLDKGLVNYQNEVALYEIKIEDRQKIIQELKNKIQSLQYKINQMQSESEFAQENINKLNEDVALAEENIKKLKAINEENQRIIQEQQIKITILESQLQKFVKLNQRSQNVTKQQIQKINQWECKNKALTLEIQLLNQKLTNQIKSKQKAKQIEIAQRKKEQKQFNLVRKDCINKQNQLDKLKQVYESTSMQLKNERFQMKNLQLSYKQCLTVIENYTKVIKDIHAKHSDLEDKLQQQKRVSKIRELNYENQIKKLNSQNKTLNKKTNQLTEFSKKHKNCIHPMIYQDIHSKVQRYQQKEEQIQKVLSTLRMITKEGEQKYKQTLIQKQKQINQLNTKLKNTEQKLILQIQYQRKKNLQLSEELSDVQLQLLSLKNNYKVPVQQFKQKQRKYLEIIKQKKQKVQNLIDQIEVMHDRNHKLMEQITYSEKELSTHRQKLSEIQQDLVLLQNQKQKAESQRDQAINQVDEIIRQFKIQLPQNYGSNVQLRELIKKSSDHRSSDVYMRQRDKSIEKHRGQAYRQSKDMEGSNGAEQINKNKTKNATEKNRREDFAHKFKNASQYYTK